MSQENATFTKLRETVEQEGIPAAFDALAEILRKERKLPQLFDALLMKKRHELNLPLQGTDTLSDLPEEIQGEVEEYYITVCRDVGSCFLEDNDIVGAWPYFRAIDEPQLLREALERWEPETRTDEDGYDEEAANKLDAVIDVALTQGAHPRRGFELALEQYGVCRAITIYEHQFSQNRAAQDECGGILVRRLYNDLKESIEYDIKSREGKVSQGADIRTLMTENPQLFEEHGYHIDMSHLQSVIRFSIALMDKEDLELALQMAEYGRKLPRDFQNNDRPPFDDFYNDYRIFLQALLSRGVDGAVRYFTQKADQAEIDEEGKHFPGEILVYLLYRAERYQQAIDAHRQYLDATLRPLSAAPSLVELCEKSEDYSALLEAARAQDDVLHFITGLVKGRGLSPPLSAEYDDTYGVEGMA